MAINWTPKAPGDVFRYTWTPALTPGDGIAAYTASATGAQIDDSTIEDDKVVLFVSGGVAGTTAVFTLQAETTEGEVLNDTVYLPIIATTATGMTVRDAIAFALRKVFGLGEEAPADAAEDALERLSDMLQLWREVGADVGAAFPLEVSSTIYCKPSYQGAIKANLAVEVADLYGREITPALAVAAVRGLQHVKNDQKPDVRTGASYY